MTNYDTTNGDPYERVTKLTIEYGTEDNQTIGMQVVTQQAMVTASGEVVLVAGSEKSFSQVFTRSDLTNGQFPMVDLVTGAATGQTKTCAELYNMMASFIRQQQKLNDAQSA